MIHNIREAFNELLHEVEWMDSSTIEVAQEKVSKTYLLQFSPLDITNTIYSMIKTVLVGTTSFLFSRLSALKATYSSLPISLEYYDVRKENWLLFLAVWAAVYLLLC